MKLVLLFGILLFELSELVSEKVVCLLFVLLCLRGYFLQDYGFGFHMHDGLVKLMNFGMTGCLVDNIDECGYYLGLCVFLIHLHECILVELLNHIGLLQFHP